MMDIASAKPWPNRRSDRWRPTSRMASVAIACIGLLASSGAASASLLGAQVTYQAVLPNINSVQETLAPHIVTPLTTFNDTKNGLTSFFIGNQLVIQNTSPLAFATGSFNGPQFSFANGGLSGAAVNPASSPDFGGIVSSTSNSVQTNFSALTPALGSTQIIDLASNQPLAGQQVGYMYLVPTVGSLQSELGTKTLGIGTYFVDPVEGITVAVDADTITIINDLPLAFATDPFNGPDLVFSGVSILGASIDPISGPLSGTNPAWRTHRCGDSIGP